MSAEPISASHAPARRQAGWGRTTLSTFWHWFDTAPGGEGPRRSICGLLDGYQDETISRIARWETDPCVCELCQRLLRARIYGEGSGERRTVAVVPVGLPDRVRAFYQEARTSSGASYPFQETLNHFQSEGVTRPFLAALLRYDALREGRPWKKPQRAGDIVLDELREREGAERVRLLRERVPQKPRSADLDVPPPESPLRDLLDRLRRLLRGAESR